MVSTFSPNLNLELVGRGDQVGTWDTPENSDWSIVDLAVGAITTIGLNNSPVVLAAAQFRSKQITFNSTLTGNVTITFPTSFTKSYEVQNLCTGSSTFVITLATTAASGQVVCCPPGETIDVFNDGANLKFKNLARVGAYWDYAGSSVPAWVSGCTVPPYLNCDGSTFSSATYPALAVILGTTTLPDTRGRYRAALNQGTGRITSSQGGVDGNTNYTGGASQTYTIQVGNLPPYTPSGNVSVVTPINYSLSGAGGSPNQYAAGSGSINSFNFPGNATFTGVPQGGASSPMPLLPPTVIAGLTLIRAA